MLVFQIFASVLLLKLSQKTLKMSNDLKESIYIRVQFKQESSMQQFSRTSTAVCFCEYYRAI